MNYTNAAIMRSLAVVSTIPVFSGTKPGESVVSQVSNTPAIVDGKIRLKLTWKAKSSTLLYLQAIASVTMIVFVL
ncbi:MAG: hypothetical protein HC903_27595 [Methylacidiphilales bacterium]|nr:hypothetical protein [Candidatus Methylacidiphilales bacterium]NJR19127.1 hypothetical protein [Calothrix sp. CSU_2_0]